MSKDFRPIFSTSLERLTSFQDSAEKDEKEKRKLQEELSLARQEVTKLREENRILREKLKELEEIIKQKEKELTDKSRQLESRETVFKMIAELEKKLKSQLTEVKDKLRNDMVQIALAVLKEFLMTDVLPKEEVITRILEEIFSGSIDLKGSVKIFLNPTDIDRAYEFVGTVDEKLSDRVEVEITSDPNLSRGEIRVETPKFIIERKEGEILEEIFREVVKRVLKRS